MRDRFLIGRGNTWRTIMDRTAGRRLRRRGYLPKDGRMIRRLPRRGLGPTWGAFWATVNRSLEN